MAWNWVYYLSHSKLYLILAPNRFTFEGTIKDKINPLKHLPYLLRNEKVYKPLWATKESIHVNNDGISFALESVSPPCTSRTRLTSTSQGYISYPPTSAGRHNFLMTAQCWSVKIIIVSCYAYQPVHHNSCTVMIINASSVLFTDPPWFNLRILCATYDKLSTLRVRYFWRFNSTPHISE